MDVKITTLAGADAGEVKLSEEIFGLDPREDILQRVVRWQLAKQQQGTHKAKGRAEVARTGAKMYKQKGTGRARHHSARAPQFRGGGKAHGPVVRSHEHDLPKKVRALGLKHALSAKAKASSIIVVDELKLAEAKTKVLVAELREARPHQRAGDRRRRGRPELQAARPPTSPTSTCCRSRASTSTTFCAAARWSFPRPPSRPSRSASND